MSATAIIVSFIMNTSEAAFCTQPMPLEQAVEQMKQIDISTWVKVHIGFTPPNIIIRGHPNYNDALNGKIVDDVDGLSSHQVPPCAPLPMK